MTGSRGPIAELARMYGLAPVYRSSDGRPRRSSDEAVLRVAAVLGAPVARAADAAGAVRARRQEVWRRVVEPVAVTWRSSPVVLPLRLPAAESGRLRLQVALEGGGELVADHDVHRLRLVAARSVEGERYHRVWWSLDRTMPEGYHHARVEIGDRAHDFLWIVAPERAFQPGARVCCAFVPLYALHSRRRPDCGDLTDLRELGTWAARHGAALTGTLPLSAAFLEPPVEPSPYAPISRLFWNEAYLDVDALPEQGDGRVAPRLFGGSRRGAEPPDLVDWPVVAATRRRVLQALCDRFFADQSAPGHPGLRAFLQRNEAAEAFARFRAVGAVYGRDWRAWPDPLRAGELGPGDGDPATFRYHLFAQWRMDEQLTEVLDSLRRSGSEPYLDLPVGVHPDGFDTWRFRGAFLSGCSAGAPPDPFFAGGQDWGFPPPDPAGGRRSGHDYFRACLRQHVARCGVLRVDHVMGLHRMFCIPNCLPAAEGVYVRQPAEELYAVLSLESNRHRCAIVGEDLGTVPRATRDMMRAHGVHSMHIVQFELAPGRVRRCLRPPAGTLAALNTHDTPTFTAYWTAQDVDQRLELGLLDAPGAERERRRRRRLTRVLLGRLARAGLVADDAGPGDVLCAVLLELARSDATFVVVNLEDLWLETRPQNVPGTGPECPNWRRRIRPTLEEVCGRSDLRELLQRIAGARGGS